MKRKEVLKERRPRRQYDAEFKASALRMIEQGRGVAEVARALGIREGLLQKWKSAAKQAPVSSESQEVEKLLRYIRQLEMEREILKKALSIFSRTT